MRSRREVLAALGTAGSASLAGCSGLVRDGGDGSGSSAVANAEPPSETRGLRYAQAGGSGPRITYYGNWKCPVCAEFSNGSERVLSLGTIIEDYVQPGNLRLRYRALAYRSDGAPFLGPDAPRAARAGLAVWNEAPSAYWPFHETVMAEQPPESETWATVEQLIDFADSAGVSALDSIRTAIERGAYQDLVEATAERAGTLGVTGTPTLVIDDELYSPFNSEQTRSALDALTD